eukprot:gene14805-biopygen6645
MHVTLIVFIHAHRVSRRGAGAMCGIVGTLSPNRARPAPRPHASDASDASGARGRRKAGGVAGTPPGSALSPGLQQRFRHRAEAGECFPRPVWGTCSYQVPGKFPEFVL